MAFEFDIIEDEQSEKEVVFDNSEVANALKTEEKKVTAVRGSIFDKFYPCVTIYYHADSSMSKIRLESLKSLLNSEKRVSEESSVADSVNSSDIFRKICVSIKKGQEEKVIGYLSRSQISYFYSLIGHLDIKFHVDELTSYTKEKLLAVR